MVRSDCDSSHTTLQFALFTFLLIPLCFRSVCATVLFIRTQQLLGDVTDKALSDKGRQLLGTVNQSINQSVLLLLVSMVTCRFVLTLHKGVKNHIH